MNNTMYMTKRQGRTFNTHSTIEECKLEAEADAMENSRKRAEYTINNVIDKDNGLVLYIYGENQISIKGKQHGKTIEWNV